ncbi:hypothetical protein [Microbacterium sp. T32]|nr:hypothetical protein [Microbacterium sp. T32]
MSRHTILLGVDGVLLVEIDSPDRDYAAMNPPRVPTSSGTPAA